MTADFIGAATIKRDYAATVRTLERAGVPSYRFTAKGKKLFRRSEIEAALLGNRATRSTVKAELDEIVDATVEEVLKGLI